MENRQVDSAEATSEKSSTPSSPSKPLSAPVIITLTTDFGTSDYFVGAMKGVILSESPHCKIVDITHDISPQDIEAAAFTILSVYRSFPAGTIHVAVVDPGVGSDRAAIIVEARNQFFVGPDNGSFGYVCDQEGEYRVIKIASTKFLKDGMSGTFHGRDLFAPVAAMLANGVAIEKLGATTAEMVTLSPLAVQKREGERIEGRIIHIDNFGNCVTNFRRTDLPKVLNKAVRLRVKESIIDTFRQYFAEESTGNLFGIWGSAGFLEIAITNGSAADHLKVRRGEAVIAELLH